MNIKTSASTQKPLKDQFKATPIIHPLRCFLPIYALFIFIVYWFIFCPLLFALLYKAKKFVWPHNWPFYYWCVALIVFIILMELLVYLWRYMPSPSLKSKNTDPEADLLINTQPKYLYTHPIITVQKTQENFESNKVTPVETKVKPDESKVKPDEPRVKLYEHKVKPVEKQLDLEPPIKDSEKMRTEIATTFPQYSYRYEPRKPKYEVTKARPRSLAMPHKETKVQLHSLGSPLSPRELFFWDLIQSANKSCNSTTHDFIEREKEYCSLDNVTLSSPSSSRSEYFIANVTGRHSETSEVYLYIDDCGRETQLQVRINKIDSCSDDDVFKR